MACTRLITLTRATRSQNWSHFTRWRRASWTRCAVFWPSLHLHLHHHHPRHFHHDHGHHHHHHDHYHQVEWLDELAKGINIIRYYCTLVLGPGSKEGRVRRGGFIAKSDNHLHNSLALFWPFRFRTIHQEITWVSSADHPAAIYPADAEAPWCGICAFQASTSIISPFPPAGTPVSILLIRHHTSPQMEPLVKPGIQSSGKPFRSQSLHSCTACRNVAIRRGRRRETMPSPSPSAPE